MSLPKRGDAQIPAEPISDVLERVRTELESIAAAIDRNQALIAKSTWNVASADADYVKAMQDADLSAQRIAGIAGFLREIGDASHSHWHVETGGATSTLTLTELIRSIGTVGFVVEAKGDEETGDVDLF